jgi:hypothetical protein
MKQVENKTILNDTISLLDSKLGPVATQSQLTQSILNNIQAGRRNFKPYIPKQLCQYPKTRSDEFNMNEGLGIVTLQPIIDGLNNFKIAAMNEIKTKFQAMGPENSKDKKLAAGAVSLIKEVYDAAKCYTQVVTNVNNLINSYIASINEMIVTIIQKIDELESQITELKHMMLVETNANYLIAICGKEVFSQLQQSTDIFDLLGAVVELQNAIAEANKATTTLLDSGKRIKMQLNIGLTLLRNRINSFLYYQSVKGALQVSLASAKTIPDDFLSDFIYTDTQESSFNWSLTNSGGIFDCNIDDDFVVIPRLNEMAKNFDPNSGMIVTIASRTEEGYIVVPDGPDGLISAGLDYRLGPDVNLIFDLSINDGETIVRAVARGDALGPNDSVTTRVIGSYYNYGKETFDYNKLINNGDGTFGLYLTDITKVSDIQIGSSYYYINPITQKPLTFTWVQGTTIVPFPLLFKVLDITNRVVKVKILTDADFTVTDFIPDATGAWTFTNTITAPPGDIDGSIKIDSSTGVILNNPIFTWAAYIVPTTGVTIPAQTVADGISYRTDAFDTQVRKYIKLNSCTLQKYNLASSINKIPHAGEQIRCHNWSLSVRISGDVKKVNNIHFSGYYPGKSISLFFLKAKWGFIPAQS